MKPFDDSISEENTAPYQALTTLLRQATPVVSVTAEEHSQMLARVRARLHQPNDVVSENISLTPQKAENGIQASRLRGKASSRRSGRMRYALNMIAAVLVVGVIAGTSLWLFSARQGGKLGGNIPTGAPVGPIKAPVTVRTEAGGLEASLQVTAGPYFLSELLAVTMTFTNHSSKNVFLLGSDTANVCNAGLFHLTMTGGSEPHYDFPVGNTFISCPPNLAITPIDVGKTLTMHEYLLLTKSGQVALISDATFLVPTNTASHVTNGAQSHLVINGMTQGSSPLDGHWPVVRITVAAKIPSDRTLSLQQQGTQVTVVAPITARSHLVSYDTITCVNTMSTSGGWDPLTTAILHERGCSGANKHWIYAIGSPGYAVAAGEIFS